MNVAKYIRREKAPDPTIHTDDYIEEFKHPAHFSVAAAGRPLDSEISGARPFAIHKSERIPLDDFGAFDAHERIRAGEHPWDVYGSYGGPLDLPVESQLLYNPNNLTDKDVFVARWQQEEGVSNDFTRRLENISTDKSLPELKAEESEFERSLKSLKSELNTLFPGDKGVAETATKEIRILNAKEKKERIAAKPRPRPRPKIVVEPVFGAEEEEAAGDDAPPQTPPRKRFVAPKKIVKLVASAAGGGGGEVEVESPGGRTLELDQLFSTFIDIGRKLDKPDLTTEELTAIRKECKIINILVPPNTKQGGMVKKFYDQLAHYENQLGIDMRKVRESIGADETPTRGRGKERSTAVRKPRRARSHTVSPTSEAGKL